MAQGTKILLTNELLQMTIQAYALLFLFAPIPIAIQTFEDLDERILRLNRSIYESLAELAICSHYFPLRYVSMARRYPSSLNLVLRLVRMANWVIELGARMAGRRRAK